MKHLKDHFFPHEDNDHKPHLLREASVGVLLLVIVAVFALSAAQTRLITQNNSFLASVVPSVLADLTNEDREENELPPVRMNEKLKKAAQMKANHMAEHGYFSHYAPTGETPWTWINKAGYNYSHAGENLAVNFSDSKKVERAWMESQMHRRNILDKQFTEVGIATAKGTYKGQETVFVVQMFGRPAPQPPARTAQAADTRSQVAEDDDDEEGAVAGETTPETSFTTTSSETNRPEETDTTDTDAATGTEDISTNNATATEGRDQQTAVTTSPPVTGVGSTEVDSAGGTPSYASVFEHLLAQPQELMQMMYMILAMLVLITTAAMVGVEIRKQHPKHAFYGVSILVLILIFSYMGQFLLFPNPIIV